MAKNEIEIHGTDGLTIKIPKPFEPIYNEDKPKKQQKWERPPDPNFSFLTPDEKQAYQLQELRRIDNGFHFYNNGELTYITGAHYGFLKHWDLGGGMYPDYRWTHAQMLYAKDIVKKDLNSYGLVSYTQKRYGKTEIMPSGMLMDSLLRPKANYFIQATKDDKARDVFKRTLNAFLSLGKSLPYIYQHTYTNDSIYFRQYQTIKRSSDKVEFKDGNYTRIEALPSKITSIQGEKITEYFLDEFASQELMDMEQLFQTLIAQCTQGIKDIIGKIWMISTVENAKSKSVPFSEKLWHESNPMERDANGRTQSGLYRMLIPYYLSDPSFIDEYGNPKIEESKSFFFNMCQGASEAKVRLLKRQYPTVIDDIFDLNKDGGLELDVLEILKHRLKEIRLWEQPMKKIRMVDRQIIIEDVTKGEREGIFSFEMFEQVEEHHIYRVGLDATSTAKNSTNKKENGQEAGKEKSKFALVVRRLTGDNQYVDVANYFIRPEKRYLSEKVALWICMYYNKFGNCRAYPERNASAGSTLTDLFESEGEKRILIRKLKYHNTDRLIESSTEAFGIYIDANNKDYRTSVMNKFYRIHGHKTNSIRLLENLLIYGRDNSDLADADGVCILSCGNFDPEKKEKKIKEKPPELTMHYERDSSGRVSYVFK
jgi:hypothetical protein